MKRSMTSFVSPFLSWKCNPKRQICSCRRPQSRRSSSRYPPLASLPSEPTETGILLPPPRDLEAEQQFIKSSIQKWLDEEWIEQKVHEEIGQICATVYGRLRVKGVDELTGVLLGVGRELELWSGWKDAFVGAWDVANRVSELLVERMGREGVGNVAERERERVEDVSKNGNGQVRGETGNEVEKESKEEQEDEIDIENLKWPMPEENELGKESMIVSKWSNFDKHKFLQRVLAGSTPDAHVDYVIATFLGFELVDAAKDKWSGKGVTDDYWKQFGDRPPKFLADSDDGDELSGPFQRLQELLKDGDDDGKRGQFLSDMIETYHGQEITKIQRNSGDADFRKRELCAKWLHHFGFF